MDNRSETTKISVGSKKSKVFYLFGLFVFSVFFIASFFVIKVNTAPPPSVVTYQGKILVGGASATTSLNMYFRIYDAPSGGTLLYTASGTLGSPTSISVTPNAGLFSVIFGESGTNAMDPSIFKDNSDMYLEVQVETETLTPRKRITSAPYAFNAKYLDGFAPSQTPTNTAYIPVSDDSGNFDFGSVTTTNLYSSGDITASSSVQSNLYCDQDGNNCFDPTSGWAAPAAISVNTTTYTTDGIFSAGGFTGYQAANYICDSEFSSSSLCQTDEILQIIRTQNITFFGTGNIDGAWTAEGPPGFTANANDCNGWTNNTDTRYGPFWIFDSVGGGMGWLGPCDAVKPLACCQ